MKDTVKSGCWQFRLLSPSLLSGLSLAALLTGCGIDGRGAEGGAFAGLSGADSLPFPLHSLSSPSFNLTIHPFSPISLPRQGGHSLQLFLRGQLDFSTAVERLVAEQLPEGVSLSLSKVEMPSALVAGGQRYEGSFSLRGVPILSTALTANLLNDRTPFILGTLPHLNAGAAVTAASQWPSLEQVSSLVLKGVSQKETSVRLSATPQRYYLVNASGELVPVWKMTAYLSKLPYEVVADASGIISMQKRFFSIDGEATIYPKNVNDSSLINYQLQDLTSDGTLTNPYLQTSVPAPYQRAQSSSEIFDYSGSDPRFVEANAFSHTDEHFRWMQSLGGKTYGSLPIQLMLHQLFSGSPNNALFIPGDSDSGEPFQIEIGDGDGLLLANLPTDWDVPSHESGHYFIYNYLKATTDESLGVHEGMADLLVFLQKGVKGDPKAACLGESICPEGSTICIEPGCLRTADNSWAYQDANWQEWTDELYPNPCCGHKHGQVLSGVVWDLVKNNVISPADASDLTFTAISYFKADSGIRDYLLALLTADKNLFACAYDSQLHQYMTNRNLSMLIPDAAPGCTNIPQLTGTGNDSLVGGGAPQSVNSSGGSSHSKGFLGLGCGTVGDIGSGLAAGAGAKLLMVLLLLLPLLASAGGSSQSPPQPLKSQARKTKASPRN